MKTFKIYSANNGHFLSVETASNEIGALVSYYRRIGAPRPDKVHDGVRIEEAK